MKKRYFILLLILGFFISKFIYDYAPLDYENNIDLKTYLGIDYNKLNNKDIDKLNEKVNEINNLKINRKNINKYYELIEELNNEIKNANISLPYTDYKEYLEENKKNFNKNDYEKALSISEDINSLNEKIDKLNNSKVIENLYDYKDKIKILEEERGKLLIKNNVDPYFIDNSLEENNVKFNLIDIENKELNITKNIENKSDIILYEKIWSYIKTIIPKDYIDFISKLEIYTDGYEDTLAYVINDEEILNKWIIAVDLRDSIDYKGNFNTEFRNTLIHEFMHLISLNNTQIEDDFNQYAETYTIDEGSLKKDSYLNVFYNKFWKDHRNYLDKTQRDYLSEEEKQELIYDFYLEHENEFVSDYAATNPVEDLAETFMYFVIEDKPKDNSIKSEKIKFLYNYEELVNLRNFIIEKDKTV